MTGATELNRHFDVVVRNWELRYTASRVTAHRARAKGAHDTAWTSDYVAGNAAALRWVYGTPPLYVQEAVLRLVRKRREQMGLPL